jgi:hypothetical protein
MTSSRCSIPATLRTVCFGLAMLFLAGLCFGKTTISLSTAVGPPTTKIRISGSGFATSVKIDIYFDSKHLAVATSNSSGSFSQVTISVPNIAQPGKHTVKAIARQGTASANDSSGCTSKDGTDGLELCCRQKSNVVG